MLFGYPHLTLTQNRQDRGLKNAVSFSVNHTIAPIFGSAFPSAAPAAKEKMKATQ